jgi:GTP diphosphokinase / guanosine-3',5'-bis(diphosphate) 3'-diphosphatase
MLSNYYRKKLDELLQSCKINLSTKKVDENLITNAFRFALDAHKNDKRASGEPYFSHPYEVALIVAKEIPLDDISVAAALLHDVVEDTKFTIKDLQAEFGNEVAEIVDGATQIEGLTENYELKQIESYKKMLLSMTSDIRIMLIKFADRLHNLRTLEFLSNTRQYRMAQETLEIYAPLAHRFGLSNVKSELEDLSFKYLDRKSYDEIANKLKEKKREREKFVKRFIEPLKEALVKENYKYEIYGRAKHIYSIYRKLKMRVKSFDEIYDLFAVRIILDTQNKYDCFAVYGICSQIYIPIPERFKNYISLPKQNGYQSIHTTLMSKEGKLVEVQIRTREMHEIAEKGIAAHWKYKENVKLNDKKIEEWVRSIRDTFEAANKDDESSSQLIESFKLNLYQDEIYCFTPKGELKILPYGSTPLDFAFEIHTEVGMRCIGAKVNGKIITLDTPLKSGSQVEIITSKNSKPKMDWEKFVVTHKAKADIRKYFNTERRELIQKGKEIFDKKIKKNKLHVDEDDFQKVLHKLHFKGSQDFYVETAKDEKKTDEVLKILLDKSKIQAIESIENLTLDGQELINSAATSEFDKYVKDARSTGTGILIGDSTDEKEMQGIKYGFANCCNPIPGDDVIGFITQTEGIKIHRKNCKNIVNLFLVDPQRIVEINWGDSSTGEFTGGIKIIGEDKPGVLNEITKTISKNFKVNIKSLNIFSKGSMFEGTLILAVENLAQLNSIIDKINSQEGIFIAERFNS